MSPRVLIVGAGPAGAACAMEIASKGFETVVFEKGAPGRDKVCGDALLPATLRSLASLGLAETVAKRAQWVPSLRFYGHRWQEALIPLGFHILPRRDLDRLLQETAEARGAKILYETEIVSARASRRDGVVVRDRGGREYKGDVLVLAVGALLPLASELGFSVEEYSGVAIRGYLPNVEGIEEGSIWFRREISPAYAWIFPAPHNTLNVGLGVYRRPGVEPILLRDLLDRFVHSVAGKFLGAAAFVDRPKGYPLRTGLRRSGSVKDRVLLAGEAVHATYDGTGDGIGPALRSGILAARILADCEKDFGEERLAAYQAGLERDLRGMHRGLTRARRLLSSRWGSLLLSTVVASSPKARKAFAEILGEEREAEDLLSLGGCLRYLFKK